MASTSLPVSAGGRDIPWPDARATAHRLPRRLDPEPVTIAQALGLALASPITTLTHLPAFNTVSMDGWAISDSDGPWVLSETAVLAGMLPNALEAGYAVPIATGAMFPDGAVAILRREDGEVAGDRLQRNSGVAPLPPLADVRPAGEEAAAGSQVLSAGRDLTPPMLGLAAAAGYDVLTVRPSPVVDVFVMGDELLIEGASGRGRLRDSLGPQITGWLASVGAKVAVLRHLPDSVEEATEAIQTSTADLILTTGGTAKGPVDQLHPALAGAFGQLVVDQVAARPGHPMVLAQLPEGRPLVGLPGNPLAAAVGFLSLAWPALEGLRGLPMTATTTAKLHSEVTAPPRAHRLMPSQMSPEGILPLLHHGPAMLSGLALADCLAVVPPGGAQAGDSVEVLALPWCR